MPVQEQQVIEGWRGVMCACGLGHPLQRGLCAALIVGAVSYALKMPKRSFREDGSVRPYGKTADATDMHYFVWPLAAGAVIASCT